MVKNLRLFLLSMVAMLAGTVVAEDKTVTFEPSDFDAVTSADFSKEKDGVTVSVTASTVTADQIRIFKGKTITIASTVGNVTKIEFTCTASGTTKYGPGCFAAQTGYTYEGTAGVWTGDAESVVFTAESNQVRATKIVVTIGEGGGSVTPDPDPDPDPNPDPDPDPSDVVKATCAEVIAGADGMVFEVTGVCTKITNTIYGNWILTDATGEITVYGTLDADGKTKNFSSLNIEVGDTVTVKGPKKTYNTTVELVDVTVLKIAKGKVEPVEVTTAANIAAFLALEAGAEAKLTLTNAQVTYVNVNNNKTDLFVRDATGAIDLYDLGIEATVGQLLNGTITVKLGANGGFVAAVKGTNELASTVAATDGGEVVATTIDLAEAASYYSDYVLLASVTLNSAGKAENEDGDALALYDRFKLGLIGSLKSDGTKYDLYGLMYDGGTQYGPELVVTKATLAGGGEIVDDPVNFTGDGTQANPYTVADLLQLNPDKIANYIAADAQVWVKGVIVGSLYNNKLEETPSQASNIAIAAQAGETDFAAMVAVNLAANSQFRTKLNVVDNAQNIGKEVLLCGNILKYFGKAGVKNLTDYVLDGQQLTTGINEVKTTERFQGAIYNVAGQRITTPAKGLYIMNGKKIVVK